MDILELITAVLNIWLVMFQPMFTIMGIIYLFNSVLTMIVLVKNFKDTGTIYLVRRYKKMLAFQIVLANINFISACYTYENRGISFIVSIVLWIVLFISLNRLEDIILNPIVYQLKELKLNNLVEELQNVNNKVLSKSLYQLSEELQKNKNLVYSLNYKELRKELQELIILRAEVSSKEFNFHIKNNCKQLIENINKFNDLIQKETEIRKEQLIEKIRAEL